MPNPQGQEQEQGRQPGESEQDYRERLRRTGAQGTEAQETDETGGTQGR